MGFDTGNGMPQPNQGMMGVPGQAPNPIINPQPGQTGPLGGGGIAGMNGKNQLLPSAPNAPMSGIGGPLQNGGAPIHAPGSPDPLGPSGPNVLTQPPRMGFTNPFAGNDIKSQIARQMLQSTMRGAFQRGRMQP